MKIKKITFSKLLLTSLAVTPLVAAPLLSVAYAPRAVSSTDVAETTSPASLRFLRRSTNGVPTAWPSYVLKHNYREYGLLDLPLNFTFEEKADQARRIRQLIRPTERLVYDSISQTSFYVEQYDLSLSTLVNLQALLPFVISVKNTSTPFGKTVPGHVNLVAWTDKDQAPKLHLGLNEDLFKAYEWLVWTKQELRKVSAITSDPAKQAILNRLLQEHRVNAENWDFVKGTVLVGAANADQLPVLDSVLTSYFSPFYQVEGKNVLDYLDEFVHYDPHWATGEKRHYKRIDLVASLLQKSSVVAHYESANVLYTADVTNALTNFSFAVDSYATDGSLAKLTIKDITVSPYGVPGWTVRSESASVKFLPWFNNDTAAPNIVYNSTNGEYYVGYVPYYEFGK